MIYKDISEAMLRMISFGCISASHAGMFLAYTKQLGNKNLIGNIIKGEAKWPSKLVDRDVLYFLAQMVVSADEGKVLPEWFMVEIIRDLPRLVQS